MMDPNQQNNEVIEQIREILSTSGAYIWFILLAMWGGTASYLTRIRRNKMPFSVMALVGEWTVSGFVGIVTALLCYKAGFDFYLSAAGSGIAGHMGGRAMGLLENMFFTRAQLRPQQEQEK